MLLAKCYQQRESFICSWVPRSKNPTVLQQKKFREGKYDFENKEP